VILKLAMPWIITAALLVGTTARQEASKGNQDQQAGAESKAQPVVPTHSKNEPEASPPKNEAAAISAKSQAAEPTIQDRKDKISYAFGMDLARDLKRQENDLNVDLLMRALKDALANKPLLMTDDEVTATLKQLEAEQKQDYEHAKKMIAEKNRRAGESFFSENAKKEGVVTLPSGLQYKILEKGDGRTPTLDDKVVCQYKATLLDGTEFDSTEKRGHAVTLPVKGIMAGWTQALQMMPVGSKWQLFIPPQLAYGEKIVNGIGPNAMLIFELEVVSIEDKQQTASAAK
jgi:FKBP-type peptidyl-prolyl cis-trans isomerase